MRRSAVDPASSTSAAHLIGARMHGIVGVTGEDVGGPSFATVTRQERASLAAVRTMPVSCKD
jgi:hypothetical protein